MAFIINIIEEINFLNKVYSKSLLNVWSLKGSVVYSLILDYQFCTCVMRISGIPQLQVIRMERLYGYKSHIIYDRWVYHCFTDGKIWASLGKAGITRISYNFRRDHTTDMRPLADIASSKMKTSGMHFRVKLEA